MVFVGFAIKNLPHGCKFLTYIIKVLKEVRDEVGPHRPVFLHIQMPEYALQSLNGLSGNIFVWIKGVAQQGGEERLQKLILMEGKKLNDAAIETKGVHTHTQRHKNHHHHHA